MLIGIVLSLPLVVFTVYTVLTVYIDENGYMKPSSAFLKIHKNQNGTDTPTAEEIVNESYAVIKEKPDFIVKLPPLFKKEIAIGPRTRRNLNGNLTKATESLRNTLERILKNETNPESRIVSSLLSTMFKNMTDNRPDNFGQMEFLPDDFQTPKAPKTNIVNARQLDSNNGYTVTVNVRTTTYPSSDSNVTTPSISAPASLMSTPAPGISSATPDASKQSNEEKIPFLENFFIEITDIDDLKSSENKAADVLIESESIYTSSLWNVVTLPFRGGVSLVMYIWTFISSVFFTEKELGDLDNFFSLRNSKLPERFTQERLFIKPNTSQDERANSSIMNTNEPRNLTPQSIIIDKDYFNPLNTEKHLFLNNSMVEIIDLALFNNAKHKINSTDFSRSTTHPARVEADDQPESSWLSYLPLPTDYLAQFLGMLYSCPLPSNTSTTSYVIKDCPSCTYGTQDSQLFIDCAALHVLPSEETIVCHVGEWCVGKSKKPIKMIPMCKKKREYAKCPQLTVVKKPDQQEVTCVQRGYQVDCEAPHITWYPGTELEIRCPSYYKAHFEMTTGSDGRTTTLCDEKGDWSRNNVSCVPECGILGKMPSSATPLVMHGSRSPSGYVPWAAALFLKEAGDLEYICSGSIISNRAVITAGHCVYTKEPGDLYLLVGSSELKKNESLLMKVAEIKIPHSYTDQQGNYGSDIAILLLNSSLQFSELLQPICVDWEEKLDFSDNSVGKVAGWGLNESFQDTSSLSYVDVPVVSVEECSNSFSVGFRKFIGFTNFCAGYTNGTGVCNGDSGAGFILQMESLWYLAGTVSISPRQLNSMYCEPKSYSLYTKTQLFLPWIKEVLENTTRNSTLLQPK